MRSSSLTARSRDLTMLIAVTAMSLAFAGCSSSTAPKSTVISGLWAANFGTGKTVVQYTTAQLASSTSAAAATAIGTGVTADLGVAFDSHGNLWMSTFGNNTILEYTAAQVKVSGTPTPAVTLSTGSNAPTGLAFDAHGNLWVASFATNTVVEYSASQLSASGSPTPAITISASGGSLNEPVGLAFDAGGNLWVSNSSNTNTVVEFASAQLAASGSPTPTVTLTATANSINGALMIAFDAAGNLWVANGNFSYNTVVAFSPSQLASSGSPVPTVTLAASASSLDQPAGLAFDGSGNLWVSNLSAVTSTIVEFSASQLVASGTPTPNVTISGTSLTRPFGLAFNPRVSGLPIK